MNKLIFLIFSCFTGFIEIGAVIYGVLHGYSVVQILLLVLAYQVGNLCPNDVSFSKKSILLLNIFGIILVLQSNISDDSYITLLLAILFISPCLQSIRSVQKSQISTGVKRSFRILGFLLSPLFSMNTLLIVNLIVLMGCLYSSIDYSTKIIKHQKKFLDYIMVLHQMHYFSYAYLIVYLAMQIDDFRGFFTSFIFVLGWITYTIIPYLLRGKNYPLYFIIGHLFLMIILFVMTLSDINTIMILWVLTGFGGGTVFCIKEIFNYMGDYKKESMVSAENFGHVFGLIACIIIISILSNIKAPIFFAALCAGGALLGMIFYLKNCRERRELNDYGKCSNCKRLSN